MANPNPKEYSIRPGTKNRGEDYELITIFQIGLHLLSLKNIKQFDISCNNLDWGDFDDVVVEIVLENGALVTLAIQLKHTNKNIQCKHFQSAKHDFSLDKYFKSYKDLHHKNPNLDGVYFVLYTTAQCQDFPKKFDWHKSLLTNKKCNAIEYLPNTGKCFRFHCENEDIRSKFLSKLFLYTNQHNVDKIFTKLENETSRFGVHNSIIDQFMVFLSRWKNGNFGGHYKMSKNDFVFEFCELLFTSYVQEPTYTDHDNFKYKDLWSRIIETVDVTIISDTQLLPLVWFLTLQKIEWQRKKQLPVEELKKLGFRRYWIKKLKNNKISDKDLYLILWKCGLVPLILDGDGKADVILSEIISFAKHVSSTHFIVRTNNAQPYQKLSKFTNLFDLSQKSVTFFKHSTVFTETLKNVSLKIQNRFNLSLEEMYNMSDDVLFQITPDLLLEIGKVSTDNQETEAVDIYINRQIVSLYLHIKELASVTNKTLYILYNLHTHLHVLEKLFSGRVVEFSLEGNFLEKNIVLVGASISWKVLQHFLNKRNLPYHIFQLIEYVSEYFLKLIEATGPVNRINIADVPNFNNDTDILSLRDNMINVISASSGMGKTTLIIQISKLYPEKIWIVKIDLKSIPFPSTNNWFSKSTDKLMKICYDLFVKQKQIVYLFDGFDEIDTNNIENCLEMFDHNKKQNIIQWITTKPARSAILQNRFNILPQMLRPLNENDKQTYFNAYTDKYIGENLKAWFKDTIAEVSKSFDPNLTNNPLQMYMICELIKNHSDNAKAFDPSNILILYQKFIKMKLEIYQQKYLKIPKLSESKCLNNATFKITVADHLNSIILKMQHYSLISIYGPAKMRDISSFHITPHEYLQCGIISHISNDTPVFVHSSYAEYFAATWFSEHWKEAPSKELFLAIYFSEYYILFKSFFDRLVSKDLEVFNVILQDNFHKFADFSEEDLKIRDKIGRNALHLVCSIKERKNISRYLNTLLLFDLNTDTDSFLNLTPFEYAIQSINTIAVEKLLDYHNFTIDFERDFVDYYSLMNECIKKNCHKILRHFVNYLNNNRIQSPMFQISYLLNLLLYAIEINSIDSTRLLLEIDVLKKHIKEKTLDSIPALFLALQNATDNIKNLFDNLN